MDYRKYMDLSIARRYLSSIKAKPVGLFLWLAVFFGLYLTSLPGYIIFHSLAELFSIVVAAGVFMVAWNSRRFFDNHYLLFLSIAFVFAALIDIAHTLAYKGMGVFVFFDPTANLATQLWLAARYLQAISFLAAPLFLTRKIKPEAVFWVYGAITALLLASIFYWQVFPTAYIEGQGLTAFKKISEYIISAMLLASAAFLWIKKSAIDPKVLKLVLLSIFAAIASELAFSTYFGVYDYSNMAGHFLKILAFYFIYKAVIEVGLTNPFGVLFSNLEKTADILRKSETKFRSMFESASEAVILADARGTISLWNRGAEKIFGWQSSEAVGKSIDITIPSRLLLKHKEGMQKMMQSGKSSLSGSSSIECTGLRKDGSEFPVEMSLVSWKVDDEMFFGAIIRDIAHRKEMEKNLEKRAQELEALSQDLKKFRLAIESASDHIVVTDENGIIVFANKAVEKITGFSLNEIISNKPSLWGKQMPPLFYKGFWRTIKERKKPFAGEIKNKRKNGDVYTAEIKVSPILDEKGNVKYFLGIERDITEQKEIDRAKTEFISLAAHQLRTPLTTISLTAEMLLKGIGGKIDKTGRQYLKDIFFEIKDMAEMIETFLNVSRIEMGRFPIEPKPSGLFEIIEKSLETIAPQIKNKKLKMEKNYNSAFPALNLDPRVMNIVLGNLLSNAVKYTPEGGKVSLAVREEAGGLTIEISDTGIGIPFNQRSMIFSKMFRADNVKKIKSDGSGLGLYIAKSLIFQSGGRMWFKSKEGEGTTFFVSLPKSGMKPRAASFQ